MLAENLYVIGQIIMPLQLPRSIILPFLEIGTMIEFFRSSGISSLFQLELKSLVISERISPQHAINNFA